MPEFMVHCCQIDIDFIMKNLICFSHDHYAVMNYLNFISLLTGRSLEGASYIHPCKSDQVLPFLPAAHVTTSKGTGLVHTAPAHGPEDYLVALEHSIHVVSRCAADVGHLTVSYISQNTYTFSTYLFISNKFLFTLTLAAYFTYLSLH
jgi:isoleucyl-tRNA synthetase